MKGFKSIRLAIVGILVFAVTGCGSTFDFGTLSKVYCESTDPAFREVIKRELVSVGVDYCTARGLVDAMKVIKDAGTDTDDSVSIKSTDSALNVAVVRNLNFERMWVSDFEDTHTSNVAVVRNLNFERQQYIF